VAVNVLLEINVKPEKVGDLNKTLQEMLPETRKHDGCISIDAVRNQENPGNVVLLQKWQSRQHYESYHAWRVKTGVADAKSASIGATYHVQYFDLIDV
jgi:quinol monooxygenase YgiN